MYRLINDLTLKELFTGSKYKFKNEGDVYQLIIMTPKVEDTGKYTIEIGGVTSTAYLNVEGMKCFIILNYANDKKSMDTGN